MPSLRTRTPRAFATGWAHLPVPTQRSSSLAPTSEGWGVAAIAGDRVRDGQEEFATYAAALRVEDGEWRLELGAPIAITYLDESPTGTVDVEIEAGAPLEAAGLWVDGEPAQAVVQGTDLSHVVVHAEQVQTTADRPVGVVFARTSDQAQAGAFSLDAPAGSA